MPRMESPVADRDRRVADARLRPFDVASRLTVPTRPRTTHAARRCPIATVAGSGNSTAQTLHFAESYVTEDLVLRTARSLAHEVGLEAVTPGAGAALRLLAAAGSARAVVEIGTGTGVSRVWLLRGMRADGVLTTIDVEVEHQRIARRIFTEAGFAAGRTRIITGRALDVLPGSPTARTTWSSWTRRRPGSPPAWTPRCGCCDRAAWSRSTARWPAAGSATPPLGTSRR